MQITPFLLSCFSAPVISVLFHLLHSSHTAPQDAITVTAMEVRKGVINITWSMPSERNGSVSYNLSYTGTQPPPYPQEEARTDKNSFVYNSVSEVTHSINNVLSFAIYIIEVFAYNIDLGQTVAGPIGSAIINRTFTTGQFNSKIGYLIQYSHT